MGNTNYSREQRVVQFNQATTAQLITKEDAEAFSMAKATMQPAIMDDLITKYRDVLDSEEGRREQEVRLEEGEESGEELPELQESRQLPDPERKKARSAYRSVTRMLRHDILKEEVMLNQEHTCPACEQTFPTKREFAVSSPGETYPLIVRCDFPVVEYVRIKGNFDPKTLAKDEKLFDPRHYTAVCTECKPIGFKRNA